MKMSKNMTQRMRAANCKRDHWLGINALCNDSSESRKALSNTLQNGTKSRNHLQRKTEISGVEHGSDSVRWTCNMYNYYNTAYS
jgi:hypothetical protein